MKNIIYQMMKVFGKLTGIQKEMEILAKELKGIGIELSFRRAILISNDINDYKVWENFNFRNGFKDMRLFSDERVALEWMKSNNN